MGVIIFIKPEDKLTTVTSVFEGEQTVVDIQSYEEKTPEEVLNITIDSYHNIIDQPWAKYSFWPDPSPFVPIIIDNNEVAQSLANIGFPTLNATVKGGVGESCEKRPIITETSNLSLSSEQFDIAVAAVNTSKKLKDINEKYSQVLNKSHFLGTFY